MPRSDGTKDPTVKTFKRLFGLSGNRCAYPKCNMPMIHETGTPLGQACHIKRRRPDSARYDPTQTEEERRAFENLILMCASHNTVVDDPANAGRFPVELLHKWKSEHEIRNANHPYTPPPAALEVVVKNFREQRRDDEMREMASWFRANSRTLKRLTEWLDRPGRLPSVQELEKIQEWFIQEGPDSYQRPDRIPWKGVVKFELETHDLQEVGKVRFRTVVAKWVDGRTGIFDMDESWFDAHGVDITSDSESEKLVREKLTHSEFRFVYRHFERGQPTIMLHATGQKDSKGRFSGMGWVGGPLIRPSAR